ncbi:MAG: hypothetical protein K0S01_3556 [Herbinix sp.]|jgi:hypothetical protein|nr:hypothetical protein [Herbinix sp.]
MKKLMRTVLSSILCVAILFISSLPQVANAAVKSNPLPVNAQEGITTLTPTSSGIMAAAASTTSTYWISRGTDGLAFCKSSVTWTYTGSAITASDAWQEISGIFVQKGGIRKLTTSTSTKEYWNATTTFLVGAVVGGVTLGYSKDWVDQIIVNANGSASVVWAN